MRSESVFWATFQQLEHLCDGFRVRVGVWTYSDPASAALYRNIKWYDAGEVERISRFKPAFCATFLPGFALVPFADRTMCETSSSSVASNATRAMIAVDVWCKKFVRSFASWLLA